MKKLTHGTNVRGYFCGHDHCKNHIQIPYPVKKSNRTKRKTNRKRKKTIDLFVIGTGGKSMDISYLDKSRVKKPDKLLYQDADLGFIVLDITSSKIILEVYSCDNNSFSKVYEYKIK